MRPCSESFGATCADTYGGEGESLGDLVSALGFCAVDTEFADGGVDAQVGAPSVMGLV
jgi:hypothetical protein